MVLEDAKGLKVTVKKGMKVADNNNRAKEKPPYFGGFLWVFLEKIRQQVEEQFQEEQLIKEQYKELSKQFV